MNQEEVWDKIALPWGGFRQYSQEYVLDFFDGKKGRVLDLGCGSGRNCLKGLGIRDLELGGLEFYGVDFSARMCELASKRGYREVKKGDVVGIPYEDSFFDFVLFNAVLHCVEGGENRLKALKEVNRVLRDGGEALISVWGRGQKRIKNRDKESFVSWGVGGEKVLRYTYIYDLDELRSELESVGFEILSEDEGENIVFVVRKD